MEFTHPLASDTWGAEERAAVMAVLDSERVTMWRRTAEFENAFARRLGVAHAVMVNSGSSANLIAVAALEQALRRQGRTLRGKVAIVPAIAWATTYAPLQQHGMRLRVVDVNINTLNADRISIEAAICPETALVVAANILGNPCDLARLRLTCNEHGILLLEDNCESLGASIGGRQCGSFGDIGTHSFFFSHQLATAEGGMLVTNHRLVADLARCLRAHGWERDLPRDSVLREAGQDEFSEAYRFLMPGYNVRPTEIAAAVGLVQLGRLDAALEQRRRNAAEFKRLFEGDWRFRTQFVRPGAESSWFGFTIIPTDAPRRQFVEPMRRAGVEFRQITGGNFLQHPAAAHYDYEVFRGRCQMAQYAHDHGFFVGNHPTDLTQQLARLREVLQEAA